MTMSSQKEQNSSTEGSEVSKFYEGKSLFITGAAGFLGLVLLETLLRCCPDIQIIYILLRSKKGVEPEDRKEQIFKNEIFYKLRETKPEVFKKVVVTPGDITKENLGMCDDDYNKITGEVSVVFHCAATISFHKPLRYIVQQNVMGTHNVIELSRKLQKLEALVYTSTAFSNCNRFDIEEKVYKMPFSAEEVIQKNDNEEALNSLFKKCIPQFPNFYTFSKCVSENLLEEKTSDLPVCIVRPSIIMCTIKGPLPGFALYGAGLFSLLIGVGYGFIRVVRIDKDKICDQIPADVVANAHILGAYHQARKRLPSPYVYNCTSYELAPIAWGTFMDALYDMAIKNPLPKSYQKPEFRKCKNPVAYWIYSMVDHYLPAVFFDIVLWISGSKLRLLKRYQFFDKSMKSLEYFTLNEWKFRCENFKSLSQKLSGADAELFPVDLNSFSLDNLTRDVPMNSPIYRRNLDKPYTPPKKPFFYYINIASLVKWAVLGGIASIFYMVSV